MLEDLPEKFGKLKMPEGSLIKKLEKIKKSTEVSYGRGSPTLFPDVIEQLRKAPEEITKKIEEMVNNKTEQIKSNTEAIKNIESQVNKIDQMVSAEKKGTEEFKDRLDKIDETVLELLSLYEVVSSTVNPFVGDKDSPVNQKLADIEKKMEEFGQRKSEIPPNLLEDFEKKLKGLETAIEELKKMVIESVKSPPKQRDMLEGTQASQNPVVPAAKQNTPQYIEEYSSGVRLPFLDNRPETSIVLLNWIEFLMEKVGRNNLFDVLEYYIEIGWISEEVSAKMMAYANGIDYYVERPTWKLLPEDHTKSLLFIEQLRGKKVDKNLFTKLERDVEKIIRSSEILTT
jgi:flagellar protein FlaD